MKKVWEYKMGNKMNSRESRKKMKTEKENKKMKQKMEGQREEKNGDEGRNLRRKGN